jgi:predicted Ser/Thr protein kinase
VPPPASAATASSAPGTPASFAHLPAAFGRYQVLKVLGQGGMGSVYLAHDTQLDRRVALKIPHFTSQDGPQVRERFFREARAAAMLHHPNLCPVYDVGEHAGTHYLTMAFIEGRPLSALIGGPKLLPPRQVAALVRKLALALAEAHRHQVIHRDLKPSNVMLGPRGEPVVMDFGLARRGGGADSRLTQQGTLMGTPAYMAPEQASGNPDEMGPSCDVYSLGVILYELLTGRLPFQGDAMSILTQLILNEPPPPSAHRPDLDPALEAICLKAMAKKPEARYRSMGELAAALADYLKAGAPAVPATAAATPAPRPLPARAPAATEVQPARTPARPAPRPKGFPWGWAVLAGTGAAAVAVGVGAVVYLAQHPGGGATASVNPPPPQGAPPAPAPAPARHDTTPPADTPAGPGESPVAEPAGGGQQPPPAPTTYVWRPDLLRDSKIPAPEMSAVRPWFLDDFADPRSGLPRGRFAQGENGYRDGFYFIKLTSPAVQRVRIPLDRAEPPNPTGPFACQVRARTNGAGGWGLACLEGPDPDAPVHFAVRIRHDGRLRVFRHQLGDVDAQDTYDSELVRHPAINGGKAPFNVLRVHVRGRTVEVYVNGVAVCDPVVLDRDVPAPHLALICFGGGGRGPTLSEYKKVTLWPAADVPPPEKRGAVPKGR